MLRRYLASLSLLALAAGGLAVAPPADAAPDLWPFQSERIGTAATAGELTAVLELTQDPGDARRLQVLARTTMGHHADSARAGAARRAKVAALAPGTVRRRTVERFAIAHGLHVVHADGWNVSVAGPAAKIGSVFGTGLRTTVLQGHRYTHASSAPAVPTVLKAAVRSVIGLDERPVMSPRSGMAGPGSQDGDSLRAAYDVPTPASGWDGAGVTVATLNLSGWDDDNLDAYADANGIVPAAGQTFTEISVDGANPGEIDGGGGDIEVALDAETVLATAPAASQRLYFGPNTRQGLLDTVNAIATGAEQAKVQVFSTSWGACEKDYPAVDQDAYSRAVDRMLAAGATAYAASGDSGAYDCGRSFASGPENDNLHQAVDFPAADPDVIGTGGTTLPDTGGDPEIAWSSAPEGGDIAGFHGAGSGGGASSRQARPAHQPSSLGAKRSVPDVASDADPASGFALYYGHGTPEAGFFSVGGTSFGAPTWAGFTAAALSAAGRTTTGFGNILPMLYASPSAFRDITVGNNHGYNAGVGYDRVTGLGVPRWSVLGALLAGSPTLSVTPYGRSMTVAVHVTPPVGGTFSGYRIGVGLVGCTGLTAQPPTTVTFTSTTQGRKVLTLAALGTDSVCHLSQASTLYDTVAPTARVTAGLATGTGTAVRLSWGGTDRTSPVTSYDVVMTRRGSTTVVYRAVRTRRLANVTGPLVAGGIYDATVRSHDAAGNASSPLVRTAIVVPRDDTAFTRAGTWARHRLSGDFGGSHLGSAVKGSAVGLSVFGKRVTVGVLRGPSSGYADVYVDGRHTSRQDLYAASTRLRQQIVVARFSSPGRHVIRIVVAGAHRAGSLGNAVYLDSVTLAP